MIEEIKDNKMKKIYLLSESCYATGGCEAIQQLCNSLNRLGHEAYIFYNPWKDSPLPDAYKHYDCKWVDKIEDSEENLLIVTEGRLSVLNDYVKIKKAVWWLSRDNISTNITQAGQALNHRFVWLKKLPYVRSTYQWFTKLGSETANLSDPDLIHFTQSTYALHYLLNRGFKQVYLLSDYLSKGYLEEHGDIIKENIVAYNPKKGIEITTALMKLAPHIKFVPIEKMTPQEVMGLLAKAKVYIDFGGHPGKDRIPREAAMMGCCVIVGLKGSACYSSDVTIPLQYKFPATTQTFNLEVIIRKITECFDKYEIKTKDFDRYRDIIQTNKEQFELECFQIFGRKE